MLFKTTAGDRSSNRGIHIFSLNDKCHSIHCKCTHSHHHQDESHHRARLSLHHLSVTWSMVHHACGKTSVIGSLILLLTRDIIWKSTIMYFLPLFSRYSHTHHSQGSRAISCDHAVGASVHTVHTSIDMLLSSLLHIHMICDVWLNVFERRPSIRREGEKVTISPHSVSRSLDTVSWEWVHVYTSMYTFLW